MARGSYIGAFNPVNGYAFFRTLVVQYGYKHMIMILSIYIGVRGALKRFLDLNETAYYREAGYPSSVNQANQAISKIPGSLMGVCGLLTDLLPFAGYEKSSYLMVYTIAGVCALLSLILIPFSADYHAATLPALLFFLCNIQVTYSDLLMTAKNIDLMKRYPNSKGNLVTVEFITTTIGGLIPSILVGSLADRLTSPRYIFWIAFPLAIQPIFYLLLGCFIEDKVEPSRNNRFDYQKAKRQLPLVIMNLIMFFAAMGSLFFGLFGTSNATFIYSVGVSIIIQIGSFISVPIYLAKMNLYLFLGQSLYFQIQPTLEYFYLADETCVPGGPAFTYTYLKTYIAIMSQVGQLIGCWLYQAILTKFKYRQIFWISTIIRIGGSFFDLMIVNRWNIAIGISDPYFYLFGHAIIYEITYMLDYLPFAVLTAKVCPKNIEGSLYALVGSYTLYGTTMGVFAGSFVTNLLGIETGLDGGRCNFENIGLAVLISNLIMPAFLIPLAIWLIPNKKVEEDIADGPWETSKYLISFKKYQKIAPPQ